MRVTKPAGTQDGAGFPTRTSTPARYWEYERTKPILNKYVASHDRIMPRETQGSYMSGITQNFIAAGTFMYSSQAADARPNGNYSYDLA